MDQKKWFLYVVDHHEGPFTVDEVKNLVKKNEARETSYVWSEGLEDWLMMSDVPEFGNKTGDGHDAPSFIVEAQKETSAVQHYEASPSRASLSDIKPGDSVFCLHSKRMYTGPHSIKTLIRKINEGEISLQDSVWVEGWTSFVSLENIAEVTKGVNASVLDPKLLKKGASKKGANMLGISSGGVGVPRYMFWRGKIFLSFVFLVLPLALYQMTAKGTIPGLQGKIPPLPIDGIIDSVISVGANAPKYLAPVLHLASDYVPPVVQDYLSNVPSVEGISENKIQQMRQAARQPLEAGIALVVGLAAGDEFSPIFHLATNLPDGTTLTAELKAKPGTLLNASDFNKKVFIDVQKNYAKTLKISGEGNQQLPRGEYTLVVYDSERQAPEVQGALARLPTLQSPSELVPEGKRIAYVEEFFLGGKNDALYKEKLAEFNKKLAEKKSMEAAEVSQFIQLMESGYTEGTQKMKSIDTIRAVAQRLVLWRQFYGKIQKMSDQMSVTLLQPRGEFEKNKILHSAYFKAGQAFSEWTKVLQAMNAKYETPPLFKAEELHMMAAVFGTTLNEAKNELNNSYSAAKPQ